MMMTIVEVLVVIYGMVGAVVEMRLVMAKVALLLLLVLPFGHILVGLMYGGGGRGSRVNSIGCR